MTFHVSRSHLILTALAAAAALVACGGGGDGGGSAVGSSPAAGWQPKDAAKVECKPAQTFGDRVVPMDPWCNKKNFSIQTTADANTAPQLPAGTAALTLALPETTQTVASLQARAKSSAAAEPELRTGPLIVGFGRELAQATGNLAPALTWADLADGSRVAAVTLSSAGAAGIAAVAKVHAAPAGTVLRWVDAKGENGFLHHSADMRFDNGVATVYSPYFDGQEMTLEIALAAASDAAALDIRVPTLQHLEIAPNSVSEVQLLAIADPGPQRAGACHTDSMCAPITEVQRRSVARMFFPVGTDRVGFCTGTLVNNTNNDQKPYFVTADHCFANDQQIDGLQTNWFFRAASCNASQLNTNTKIMPGGATVLHRDKPHDFLLLELKGTLPEGVMFQGTYSGTNTVGEAVWGWHHPRGALQKYSTGKITSYSHCEMTSGLQCKPTSSTQANSGHLQVNWSQGTTEGGSSGSGLLRAVDNQLYLVGVLSGGAASCQRLDGADHYGRFDKVAGAVAKWLRP